MKAKTTKLAFIFFVVILMNFQSGNSIFASLKNSEQGSEKEGRLNDLSDLIDDEHEYEKVALDSASTQKTKAADFILVVDTSSSMIFGNTQSHSPCLNEKHYQYAEMTKTVKLKVNIDKSIYPNAIRSTQEEATLSLRLKIHVDKQGTQTIVNYAIKGLPKNRSSDKLPILDCMIDTEDNLESGFSPQYSNYIGDFEGHEWNRWTDASVSRLLTDKMGFGNVAYQINGNTYYMPTDASTIDNSLNGADIYNHEKGCISRLTLAKETSLDLVEKIYQPHKYFDSHGKPYEKESDHRLSIVTFDENVKKYHENDFYSVSNILEEKEIITSLSTKRNMPTVYENAFTSINEIIRSRNEASKGRPVYVIFVSDDNPMGSMDEKKSAEIASKDDKLDEDVHTFGVDLKRKKSFEYVKGENTKSGYTNYINEGSSDLSAIFTTIENQLPTGVAQTEIDDFSSENATDKDNLPESSEDEEDNGGLKPIKGGDKDKFLLGMGPIVDGDREAPVLETEQVVDKYEEPPILETESIPNVEQLTYFVRLENHSSNENLFIPREITKNSY